MGTDDDRQDLDPADVEPTDNSSGAAVDLNKVDEIEADLVTDEPPQA